MCQAPFVEHRPCHCRRRAGQFSGHAGLRIIEQPFLEGLGFGVSFDGALQQSPFHCESDGVGRLITLALSALALGAFERREQCLANLGWANGWRHLSSPERKFFGRFIDHRDVEGITGT